LISLRTPEAEGTRSITHGERYVALLLAVFAVLAAIYATCTASAVMPFNAGSWVVGEEVAMR
jgi:hypothetical protein